MNHLTHGKIQLAIVALLSLSACGETALNHPAAPLLGAPSPALSDGVRPPDWKLVWSDEFEGDGLPDPSKWAYDTAHNKAGWHNDERQYYAAGRLENSRVAGGKLIIEARKEKLASQPDYGGQAYSSARLITRGKQDWTYGFMEVRAKLPCGLGTWPAIWTLGTKGAWPADGEIDIMEHVGRKKGEVLGTVHTTAFNHKIGTQRGGAIMVPDACDTFHNYQLHWTADAIRIGVDDKTFFTFANAKDGANAKWPFSHPQYLILNLAIGGQLGGPVDDAIFPVQMEVDYVRVYQPQP
ncbi:MAG: family 16 glycosylhydrolase [Gammaproteobacteria bacterium]